MRIEKKHPLGCNQRGHNTDVSSSGGDNHSEGVAERCSIVDGTLYCNTFRCIKELCAFSAAVVWIEATSVSYLQTVKELELCVPTSRRVGLVFEPAGACDEVHLQREIQHSGTGPHTTSRVDRVHRRNPRECHAHQESTSSVDVINIAIRTLH